MMPRIRASSTVITVLALLGLAAVFLFLRQVFIYYRQISAGDYSGLPQYASQFTFAERKAEALPAETAEIATADDPSSGPPAAKLTVVEFLDYQCPFCEQAHGTVRELAAAYSDRVRFIIRDFPVPELHPQALIAAEAAGCAEVQGKFWLMHDRLFALKGELARERLDEAAGQIGLDLKAYAACMDGHERLREIEQDAAAGVALGVHGTPTFFFNGRRVEGAIPKDAFERIIQQMLGESH